MSTAAKCSMNSELSGTEMLDVNLEATEKILTSRKRRISERDASCVNEYGWNLYELRKFNAALAKFGYDLKTLARIVKTKTKEQIIQYITRLRSEIEDDEEDLNDSTVEGVVDTANNETENPEPVCDLTSPKKWLSIMEFLRSKGAKPGDHGDLSDVLGEVLQQLSAEVRKNSIPMTFKGRGKKEIKFDFFAVYDYLACVSKGVQPPPPTPFVAAMIEILLADVIQRSKLLHGPEIAHWLMNLEMAYKERRIAIKINTASDGGEPEPSLDYMSLNPLCIKNDLLRAAPKIPQISQPSRRRSYPRKKSNNQV